jgi:flagellar protein FliL
MADKKPEAPAPPAEKVDKVEAPEAPKKSGGLGAWLPLIIAVVTMPALAYATTHFVLLPRLQKGLANSPAEAPTAADEHPADAGGKTEGHGKAEGGKGARGKARSTVALNKMIVNVAGTMGTRYLLASITLAGTAPDFKNKVEESNDQLLDLATSTLSTKTIADLEKAGARNEIRSELLTALNNALGENLILEIFITELAIQ